jgi:thiamine-phosphate pyrophosphorylase
MTKINTRILDANLNRLREALRVIEDISRYIYDDKPFASKVKHLRHQIRYEDITSLLENRDIKGDVLKKSTASEQTRINIQDIIVANFKRGQESSRVLEELFKISSIQYSEKFKSIRYELYDLEKHIV